MDGEGRYSMMASAKVAFLASYFPPVKPTAGLGLRRFGLGEARGVAAPGRPVLRRAQTNRRGPSPAVGFTGGKEGLIVKADCGDAIVEYRMPGTFHEETLWLPFDLLSDCEGKHDDPVELAAGDEAASPPAGRTAAVRNSSARRPARPQQVPVLPTDFEANPSRLLQAIADASDTATRTVPAMPWAACNYPAAGRNRRYGRANCSSNRVSCFPGRTTCSSHARNFWPRPNVRHRTRVGGQERELRGLVSALGRFTWRSTPKVAFRRS